MKYTVLEPILVVKNDAVQHYPRVGAVIDMTEGEAKPLVEDGKLEAVKSKTAAKPAKDESPES